MNRQSQQLVVASVVAFLTSGVITLAGLSAAEPMPPMDGGGGGGMQSGGNMQGPPPGGNMQGPPPGDHMGPPPGGNMPQGGMIQGDWNKSSGTNTYTQPAEGSYQPGSTKPYGGDYPAGSAKGGFYPKDGEGFQQHGTGYFPGKGATEGTFPGKGATEGFFPGKSGTTAPAGMGNDAHMGRFDRKGGFDHKPTAEERSAFEGGDEETRKGMMKKYGGEDTVGVGEGQPRGKGDGDRDTFMEQMRDSLKGRRSEGHAASDEGEDVDVSDVENVGEWTPQDVAAFIKETKEDVKELGQEVKEVGADVKEVKKDITTANKAIDKADGDLSAKLEQFVDAVTGTHQEVAQSLETLPAAIADEKVELQEVLEAAYDDPDLQKYIKPLETLLQTCTKLENKVEKIETLFEKLPDLHA